MKAYNHTPHCKTVSAILFALIAENALSATIIGLGFLPGDTESQANAVSDNGRFAVGYSRTQDSLVSVRWDLHKGTIEPIGVRGGSGSANDISANGRTVVGEDAIGAYRWTASGGLEHLVGGYTAQGVTPNGKTVVGLAYYPDLSSAIQDSGTVWDKASNPQRLGPTPEGYQSYNAVDISADAGTITGSLLDQSDLPGRPPGQAFKWTSSEGFIPLGFLDPEADYTYSFAFAMSEDGSTIVGASHVTGKGNVAFRWTESEGMRPVSSSRLSVATDVSQDGSVIVGGGAADGGFVWDSIYGERSLFSLLSESGADLSGWEHIGVASGVSSNGRFIVGQGVHNGQREAFLVDLRPRRVPDTGTSLALFCLSLTGLLGIPRRLGKP